jgi:hypothetical protein
MRYSSDSAERTFSDLASICRSVGLNDVRGARGYEPWTNVRGKIEKAIDESFVVVVDTKVFSWWVAFELYYSVGRKVCIPLVLNASDRAPEQDEGLPSVFPDIDHLRYQSFGASDRAALLSESACAPPPGSHWFRGPEASVVALRLVMHGNQPWIFLRHFAQDLTQEQEQKHGPSHSPPGRHGEPDDDARHKRECKRCRLAAQHEMRPVRALVEGGATDTGPCIELPLDQCAGYARNHPQQRKIRRAPRLPQRAHPSRLAPERPYRGDGDI